MIFVTKTQVIYSGEFNTTVRDYAGNQQTYPTSQVIIGDVIWHHDNKEIEQGKIKWSTGGWSDPITEDLMIQNRAWPIDNKEIVPKGSTFRIVHTGTIYYPPQILIRYPT